MNQTLVSSADLDAVMIAALGTGLLSTTVTIQQPSGTYGASGAPDGNYTNVSGLVDLRCIFAPVRDMSLTGTEAKMPAEILTQQPQHVLLEGYYPAITTKYIALVDSVVYDIAAVEHDSQRRMTRLTVGLGSL